jgi:hypothetical protein
VFAEPGGVHACQHRVLIDAGITSNKHVHAAGGCPRGDGHEVASARAHLAAVFFAQHILHTCSLLPVRKLGSRGSRTQMRRRIDKQKSGLWYVSRGRLPHEGKSGPTCNTANMLHSIACSRYVTGSRQQQLAAALLAAARMHCQKNTCTSGERSHLEVGSVVSVDWATVDERSVELHWRPALRLSGLRVNQQPCEEHRVWGCPSTVLDDDGECWRCSVGRRHEVMIHELAE